jgi:hypothetical protein
MEKENHGIRIGEGLSVDADDIAHTFMYCMIVSKVIPFSFRYLR